MRTRTSPTLAGTLTQWSWTGSLSTGAAWTSSRTLRASEGVSWYRNGGLAVASTNACDAGSSTTGACVLVTAMFIPFLCVWKVAGSGGRGQRRGLGDQLGRLLRVRDSDRVRGAGDLHRAARAGAAGQEALQGRGDVAVLL